MKIIITGATGSLGAFLTRWFAAKGHQIISVGRTSDPPQALLACSTYIRADVTQLLHLPEADVCIHCAGLADDKADPAALFNANVVGTQNVLWAAAHCKLGIYVSSSSVYLYADHPLVEEMAGEHDNKHLSDYGMSKLLGERVVLGHARHESCFILRPRAVYGAGDKVLLPRLLRLVRNDNLISVGEMNVHMSLTHFSNFALAVEACMNNALPGKHVYNVADDKVYVLRDVVRKLATTMCGNGLREKTLPLWIFTLLSTLEVGDYTPLFINTISRNLVLDTTKIRRDLGYQPVMNLDMSLEEIDRWVQAIGGVDVLRRADPILAWSA